MASVISVKPKSLSLGQLVDRAAAEASNNLVPPMLLTQEETGELKGITIPLKVRVRTIAGIFESDGVLVCRAEVLRVSFASGRHIDCTGSHKLLLDEATDAWAEAKDLQPGSLVRLEQGYDQVTSVVFLGTAKVADICVPGPHSYLLENGLVSHNSLVGSTQLAMNIAALGYKVVVVPLEMSKIEMASRFMANLVGLDVTKILQRRLTKGERAAVEEKYTKWVKKVKKAGGRLTVFKPTDDLDIEEVFAAVNTYGPDVVLVDYISLLKGSDGDDAWQQLGAMARKAKINAESTNRVNILLCQVSDEGKIRYARAISEHSTNSWVWVAKKEERQKDVGRITVEQPKSRNSRSFSFDIGVEWAHMRVVEVDQSDDVGGVAQPMKNLAEGL